MDTYCRTVKYLLGLALAVPCVTYDWVKESIRQVRRREEGKEWRGGKERGGERKEERRERGRQAGGQWKREGVNLVLVAWCSTH